MSSIGRVVLIERIVMGVLFLCFCLYADSSNRRVKALEAKCGKCDCLSAVLPELCREEECRKADRDNFQYQIDALKKKCADCGKCSCPAKMKKLYGACECCDACACPKDDCKCAKGVGKCRTSACTCGKKEVAVPKFSCFKFIQIYQDRVWFCWIDADGGEHETRMTLAEFEKWGDEHESDE